MSKKYTNKSKLLGKIGTENYRVSNCPVHLPKENIKFFMAMQDAGNKDPFSSDTWNNQITPDWKKPFHESIVSAISKGIKNALNESNGLVSDEECLRANLVCLYDHSEQNNFFIIKNPSVEDIEKIGTFHDRYYWHKKDTDDKKDRLVAEMIQWAFYNVKLDGLTSIEYDDENINLCSFDLKNDEDLYKFVYKLYLDKDQWANSSKLLDRLKYVLNMIDQIILNKRDHYGFGLGTRLSFIEYFFKEYKENLEKYNKGDRDYLKRIKEKEQILSSYDSFKSYMKEQVKKSVCAGDSSSAILLLNLKTEQIFDQAPKTKIHFIKTFQEYIDEMYKLLIKDKVNESFDFLKNKFVFLNKNIINYTKKDNKKALYESIMASVAREVKKTLNTVQLNEARTTHYDKYELAREIENLPGFDDSIIASDRPKTVIGLKFNKLTGKLVGMEELENDRSDSDYYIWPDHALDTNYNIMGVMVDKDEPDMSVYIGENSKLRGIQIMIFSENNVDIVRDFVKNNLDKFDTSSVGISQEDMEKFDEYFSSIVENYESITKKGTFTAYFPNRNTLISTSSRAGMSNIPHITISKPNRRQGNYMVTIYCERLWAAKEWPDRRYQFDKNGNSVSATAEQVIEYLERTKSKWGRDLDVVFK